VNLYLDFANIAYSHQSFQVGIDVITDGMGVLPTASPLYLARGVLRAGLPAPGEDMGGWYNFSSDFDPPKNMTGYIPGHTFGQYLSGLARATPLRARSPLKRRCNGW